jgi:osmotically-inducible protein OsmY
MGFEQRSRYSGARLDPRLTGSGIEAAVVAVLGRNRRLVGSDITVTAGPDGLVTLAGRVATQALRREVELACWTVPGVRSLHDELLVGR